MANIQPCKLRCENAGAIMDCSGFGDSQDNEEERERGQLKTP
jgi:hypothetical protein